VNISIPGNTLGTGGAILFVLSGYLQNNSGSSKGLALRVLFGGTTMWGDATSAIHYASGGGGVFPVLWFFVIGNYGATNNQVLTGFLGIGNTSAGSIAGTGQITGGVDSQTDMYGAAAVDTTVAQSLVVQAQLSAASPSWGFIETSKVILLP
jgi:hypothetical protein